MRDEQSVGWGRGCTGLSCSLIPFISAFMNTNYNMLKTNKSDVHCT